MKPKSLEEKQFMKKKKKKKDPWKTNVYKQNLTEKAVIFMTVF